MKRFVFRLERLLRIRRGEEDREVRRLAEAMAAESDLVAETERRAQERRRAEGQIGNLRTEDGTAGTLLLQELALRGRRRHEALSRAELQQQREQVEIRRKQFLEVRSRRMSLEKLRQRRRDAWETELTRADQRENDEIAARLGRRKRREVRR